MRLRPVAAFFEPLLGRLPLSKGLDVFTAATVSRLATESGLRVKNVATRVSPSGWIDSIRNALLDMRAPQWLVGRFTHNAPALLAIFTIVDSLEEAGGGGIVLCAILQRPPL